jgi:hypothetical protein
MAVNPHSDQSRGLTWINEKDISTVIEDTGTERSERVRARLEVWNTSTLVWDRMTQPGGVGGGGGGPATIADGADVAQGTTTDVAWVSGSGTVISLLKKIASAGGSAVSVADGADVAQGTTTDTSAANTVVGILKAIKAAITGTLTVSGTVTSNQGGTWTVQPGNTANTTAWKVDGSAVTQPVSGTVTVNQGTWVDNIAQFGGTAVAVRTVPANADGQVALPVSVNAIQYATYDVGIRNIASGALTANVAAPIMSFEHSAGSTKTVRIRRLMIHARQTTALAGSFDIQVFKGTAASTGGTAATPNPRKSSDPACEVVVKSLPTIVAATLGDTIPAGGFSLTTTTYSPPWTVYDWQESGETKPLMLRAGVLEAIVFNVISTAALNLTLTMSVDFTEE